MPTPPQRRSRPGRALALLVAMAAVGVAGCGVPIDSEPRAITRTTLDPDLGTPRQTPTTSDSPAAAQVTAYFMRNDNLQGWQFRVDGEPTLEEALAFATGDAPPGLTTSIPSGTAVRSAAVEDQIAVIDLTSDINDVSGQAQKQAYAQLVFTAFAHDDLAEVRFMVDGRAVDAPTDNGNRAAVTQYDYDDLRPET